MQNPKFGLISAFFLALNLSCPVQADEPACPLRKSIGQMFLVEVPSGGTPALTEFKQFNRENNIGGALLFGWSVSHIKAPNDAIKLTNEIQRGMPTGMFIGIDQEGGIIQRLNRNRGFTKLPQEKQLGDANDPSLAFEFGRITASELKAVGVNWNFAPDMDVATNPNSPAIAKVFRAISSNPKKVGKLGSQVIQGIESEAVISTAKHFPGHGDTQGDSHSDKVFIDKSWEELTKTELVPFVEAVNAGVSSIMVGHIEVPKVCPGEPATLSRFFITEILRKKMGFKGLIVTDDLSMGAITNYYNAEDAATKAILAGNDVLIVRNQAERQIIPHLCRLIAQGDDQAKALEQQIKQANTRILAAKKSHGILNPEPIPVMSTPLSTEEHQKIAAQILKLAGKPSAQKKKSADPKSQGLKDLISNP